MTTCLVRATPRSAGIDITTPREILVPARKSIVVDTGIRIVGQHWRIASKSGLSAKYGIEVGAGVVNGRLEDGGVRVILRNHGSKDRVFDAGDRIAQLICETVTVPDIVEEDDDESVQVMDNILRYEKLSQDAYDLVRPECGRMGIDLKTPTRVVIPARRRVLVDLQIRLRIMDGHYGRLASTYHNAVMWDIEVGAGVIDEDYRGRVMVLLYNHGDTKCVFERGQVVAQLILHKVSYPKLMMTTTPDGIDVFETVRQDGGFGSTGK